MTDSPDANSRAETATSPDSPESPDSPDSPDSADSPDSVDSPAVDDTAADSSEPDDPERAAAEAGPARSTDTDELWAEVDIQPLKLALPGMVGYTLRAYRMSSQLSLGPAAPVEDDDLFADQEQPLDEADTEAGTEAEPAEAEPAGSKASPAEAKDAADGDLEEGPVDAAEPLDEEEPLAEEPVDEEVPVFLSHEGKLLLFGSPESLVSFITSDAPHDLTQLDTWPTLVKRIGAADIVPTAADTYELDLVVENLRGGHDSWDVPLLVSAGELARDVGWALRISAVIIALGPGSPLDDLDEALRAAAVGGLRGMLARRKLRRIGAQQASLGWRTVIGKISAAVDWRD